MTVLSFGAELCTEDHHVHRTIERARNDTKIVGNDPTVAVDKQWNIVAEIERRRLVHNMDDDILPVCMVDSSSSNERIHPSEERCHSSRASA